MTREEAIEYLNKLYMKAEITDVYGDMDDTEPYETAIDMAIEALSIDIIRCKDCKHMIINKNHEAKPMICCLTKMCGTTDADWFCADGERKNNERT